jgi:cytochrome c oxidase subunit II
VRRIWLLAGIGVLLALAAACGLGQRSYSSHGERIFFTGANSRGERISYEGGFGMMMGMMRVSCAQCHGSDGRGGRTMMFTTPNITYRNLTDPQGMLEPSGERGHTYTDAMIRQAITEGLDAEGEPLDSLMPRWRMDDEDLSDLIDYLKTLP